MTARTQYHVVPEGNGWKVEHGSTVDGHYDTKESALGAGREAAKADPPSQLVVHKQDGQVETEYTYRDDPFPPAG
ncbi:DUF2188 domain-containing protein [Micromonospora sp. WMMD1102]|uniref:DUF2188 domain-containing protein n=1 Tax=Micromonosporaceae TaxID=28056 RepID=UPI00241573C4|nr:DUF2188 domain-containing protein [Micromonospora sp. WMMD1102]MDG4787610.1 DUF2188 domain-containing protein [Micromonospora sp. WMMD1102]